MELNYHPKPASKPTNALPGSEAKIIAMQRRASNGQAVFHERDVREEPDRPTWNQRWDWRATG